MKKLTLIFLLIFSGVFLSAQKDSSVTHIAKNSFFIEFGGNAAESGINWPNRFSINYDRILSASNFIKSTIRIGYTIPTKSYYAYIPYNRSEHIVPIMINLLIGKKSLFFEMGLGGAMVFFNSDHKHVYGAVASVLGLRYQGHKRGMIARIGITPTLGNLDGRYPRGSRPYFGQLIGVSIGYSF